MTLQVASIVRGLPHRKTRTRRPPGLEHFVIGPRGRTDPLEQIENKCVDGVVHGTPRVAQLVRRLALRPEDPEVVESSFHESR